MPGCQWCHRLVTLLCEQRQVRLVTLLCEQRQVRLVTLLCEQRQVRLVTLAPRPLRRSSAGCVPW